MPYNPYTNYDFGNFFGSQKKRNPFNVNIDQPDLSPDELPGNQLDFSAPSGSDTSPPETNTDKYGASQYLRDIQDAFMKESRASTAYRQHMTTMPTENISGWRRAGAAGVAGLLALGGDRNALDTSQQVLHAPYQRAMQQWALQGQGLKDQADIENKNLQTRLGYAKDLMSIEKEASDDKFKAARENRLSTSADFKKELDSNKFLERQVMDKWRQEHGNAQFDLAQAHQDYLEAQSEVRTAQGQERIGIAQQNANTASRNAGTQQQRANTYDWLAGDQSARGWYNSDLKANKSDTTDEIRPGSAMNQIRAGSEAAKRLVIKNPKYAKYVDDEGKIVPPKTGGGIFGGGTPVAPENDPDFARFLADLEKERNSILTPKRKNRPTQPVGPQLPKAVGGLKF